MKNIKIIKEFILKDNFEFKIFSQIFDKDFIKILTDMNFYHNKEGQEKAPDKLKFSKAVNKIYQKFIMLQAKAGDTLSDNMWALFYKYNILNYKRYYKLLN